MESGQGVIEQSFHFRYSCWVREALDELPGSFAITDPCIYGHPIVYASTGLLKMFGYSKDEVIGKNGKMFQGPKTNRRSVMEIREAIREERAIQITLLNYKKDGTAFWMLFRMRPVFSVENGRVIHFVGVQEPNLSRSRSSGCRNGMDFLGDGARICKVSYRCRMEICSDSVKKLTHALSLDSALESDGEVDRTCEPSDAEKRKSTAAISNILSVLTHYSELTGRLACGKRCCLPGMGLLTAALNISLGRIKQSFVLTDPYLPDMPIVYASDAFLRLTGFGRHEVLGRNCRFLSGPDTDPATQIQIKDSIKTERPCTVRILNFRKDRTSFWNFLHISPVRDATGKVAYFVGVQIHDTFTGLENQELIPEMRQLSTVAAVKVAVRSSSMACTS